MKVILLAVLLGATWQGHDKGAQGAITFTCTIMPTLALELERDGNLLTAHIQGSDGQAVNATMRVLLVGAAHATIAWDGVWALDTDAQLAFWLPEGSEMLAEAQ